MVTSRALLERRSGFKAVALGEEAVAAAWEGQLLDGQLRTSSGERLEVVYRGRRNVDAGPDFHDAIVALEGGRLLHGDVEIHVRASDWHAHGHHRNRRYNSVVLHVVMWDDVGQPTLLASGGTAPVLAMYTFLNVPIDGLRERAKQRPLWQEPCSGVMERIGPSAAARLLESAGQARLLAKAARFEAAITCRGPEEALYEGVMEALGYAKNREPFCQLAEHLPLATLEGLMHGKEAQQAACRAEAILLGVAGLLPSQCRRAASADYASTNLSSLEEHWIDYGGYPSLSEEDWNFFRTRPENFPTRRIAGMAQLISRSLDRGLTAYLLHPLDLPAPKLVRRSLVAALLIDGPPGDRSRSRLIGHGRAMVMAVNVVLPFAVAYGSLFSRPELVDRARWAYFGFPKLPSDTVIRQTGRQIFGVSFPAIINSASRQQGLHHLFKEFYRPRRCGDCPMKGDMGKRSNGEDGTELARDPSR